MERRRPPLPDADRRGSGMVRSARRTHGLIAAPCASGAARDTLQRGGPLRLGRPPPRTTAQAPSPRWTPRSRSLPGCRTRPCFLLLRRHAALSVNRALVLPPREGLQAEAGPLRVQAALRYACVHRLELAHSACVREQPKRTQRAPVAAQEHARPSGAHRIEPRFRHRAPLLVVAALQAPVTLEGDLSASPAAHHALDRSSCAWVGRR